MWYSLLYKDEKEVRTALRRLTKRKIVAHGPFPVLLPSMPSSPFPGLIFPEEVREEILHTLKLNDGPTTATTDPKLRLILTQGVTVLGQLGDRVAAVEDVLKVYAPELGLHIIATNPHGSESTPGSEEGIFHIRFYATPRKSPDQKGITLARAFGITLPPGIRDALPPSGLGIPIRSPEGIVVAELLGNTLFVLFDLPHGLDEELPCHLLARIMELVVEIRAGQGQKEDIEDRYTQLAMRRHRLKLVALLGKRRALLRKIEESERAIAQAKQHLEPVEDELATLQAAGQKDTEAAARQEFKKLERLPHVMRIEIEGGYLRVYTDEVYLQHAGKTYPLGRYQIRIPIDEGRPLAILNENPKRVGETLQHHPHIHGDGTRMCLGNFAPITQLIATWQWGVVAQLMIEFLHYINADHTEYVKILQAGWTPLPESRPCSCGKM